ncbi:branched-chain amino acid aminotransferase II [Piedraia hortae CBS 480.64]|uniref:Branched-chain-amino-acid aminotransferase n=1 Tax=Piedraia hortae CBS 480.64 TaxID=1314780 RepID=A0A6A7C9G1_9PEZI|nr:branched-chain amino acid aminotransferase II [Piedraia hortae CBS 480.64]
MTANLAQLDASRLTRQLTKEPRPVPSPNGPEAWAQNTCTDHMIAVKWTAEKGWDAPELKPYGPLSIMPSASVLHYATECFEGLKLYRGYDSRLRLFRVARNCQRMRQSVTRVALPDFDPVQLEKLIVALSAQDGSKWLPPSRTGGFLYVRPAIIATDPSLGIQRPKEALLYIILAVFPDMSLSDLTDGPPSTGLKLLASDENTIRAWPGGFGYAKVGANYGPSLVAQGEARSRGFDQVLWLFGAENFVTEAGGSNFFVVIRSSESNKVELITAPLKDRIILEGVTRASILDLARERLQTSNDGVEAVQVVEKQYTMAELIEAKNQGRLLEAFAAGTAFFIAPVSRIHFRGQDIDIPTDGVYARTIRRWLEDIQYGRTQNEWATLVTEAAM